MQSFLQFRNVGRAVQAQIHRGDATARRIRAGQPPATHQLSNTHESPSQQPRDDTHGRDTNEDIEVANHGEANNAEESRSSIGRSLPQDLEGVFEQTCPGHDGASRQCFIVTWEGPDDPLNPRNWAVGKRVIVTLQISLISAAIGAASGIDAAILPQASEEFDVSDVVESLATGLYLIGVGFGSLFAGPFSETFGRNLVYIVSVLVFMIWIMGAGLSPNIGAQLIFRFLAGCCASTPIVCAGGSVSDMWNSLEKTWSFPLYTSLAFPAPMLGAVMGAYIGPSHLSWRWTEWIMLILSGLILVFVLALMPETFGPVLLRWKAEHFRRITGDERFCSEHEILETTLLSRLKVSMTRPFLMLTEPIVMAMSLYISILYIVMFTFLVGWPYIFEKAYDISQGLTHIIFIAMVVGCQCIGLLIPWIYSMTSRAIKRAESREVHSKRILFSPEIRLWYAMAGAAISIPISLFWMGWTSNANISIWSPILASSLFGFGITGVFICTYMYIIDSYEIYSASALTFVSLTRYVVAGGTTIVGIPFYESMGTNYALTIMACISAVLVPIPYLLYFYGDRLRAKSKYAVSPPGEHEQVRR